MLMYMINFFRESGLDISFWRRSSVLTSKWIVKFEVVVCVFIFLSGFLVVLFDFFSVVLYFFKFL